MQCLVQEHHLSGRRVDVKRAVNKDDGGGGTGGGGGGMGAGGGGGGGGTSIDKTVDWACPECGNTNQGWRHTCTRWAAHWGGAKCRCSWPVCACTLPSALQCEPNPACCGGAGL